METMLLNVDQTDTDKLQWISRLEPISMSIVDISSNELISKVMNYLKEISEVNANNLKLKFQYVLRLL